MSMFLWCDVLLCITFTTIPKEINPKEMPIFTGFCTIFNNFIVPPTRGTRSIRFKKIDKISHISCVEGEIKLTIRLLLSTDKDYKVYHIYNN